MSDEECQAEEDYGYRPRLRRALSTILELPEEEEQAEMDDQR